jgi:hypothetical protein
MAATNRQISTPTNTCESETAGRYCQAIGAPVIRIEIGQVLMERDASKVSMRRHLEVSDSDDPNDTDYDPNDPDYGPGSRQGRDNAPEAERIIDEGERERELFWWRYDTSCLQPPGHLTQGSKSYLHQNRAYCPRVRRECTHSWCQLRLYNRRYGPQQNGGAVGSAGPVQGGPGTANHISTKTGPISFALGASVPLIGAH